jgi:hypothetical protein
MRQGDVLLTKVKAIPVSAKAQDRDGQRIVLAYGEVTGHAHAILEPNALLFADGDLMYLHADGRVTLRHEEHTHLDVPAGDYIVTRQREYSPEAIRSVAD